MIFLAKLQGILYKSEFLKLPIEIKRFLFKLEVFPHKLKVMEILLFLKPQNRSEKSLA